MTQFTDCHAHLDDPAFPPASLVDVVARARIARTVVVAVACDSSSAERVFRISDTFPDIVFPSCGLHPENFVKAGDDAARAAALAAVLEQIDIHHERLVAVGECGLDFSPWLLHGNVEEEKSSQREMFHKQIAVAQRWQLPLNVHSRNAGRHAIDVLVSASANGPLPPVRRYFLYCTSKISCYIFTH